MKSKEGIRKEGLRLLHGCLRALISKAACRKHILPLCIKHHLFPWQIFLYRNTHRTLARKAAAEHGENGISRPWESIKERNSIGTEAVIYDGGCEQKREREQNECDHKQVFKVTFSWEINWNLWSSAGKMFTCHVFMWHVACDIGSGRGLHDKLKQFY